MIDFHVPDKIRSIAQLVRTRTEKLAAAGYAPSDLCGLCIDASKEIYKLLTEAGFHAEVHRNGKRNHWFVVCDGFIIDVTATQFENEIYLAYGLVKCDKVEIRSTDACDLPWFWLDHVHDPYHETTHQLNWSRLTRWESAGSYWS